MKKNTKNIKNLKYTYFFMLMTLAVWMAIVVVSFLILKTGGHLRPKAAGQAGNIALGRISDGSGVGVGRAKLTLLKDGIHNYLFTDSGGNFTVENISGGTYNVLIEAAGFNLTKGVIVIDSNTNSYTFTLSKDQ